MDFAKNRAHGGLTTEWLLVHCLGFGACWGWVHTAFFSGALWGSSEELLGLHAWLVNVVANGLTMVVVGILAARWRIMKSRAFVGASLALVVLGTLGLSASGSGEESLVFAGAVSSGFGSAVILLLWAESYAFIPPNYAKKRTLPGSMLMGVVVFLIVNMLPQVLAVAVVAFLPVVSVALSIWCTHEISPAVDESAQGPTTSSRSLHAARDSRNAGSEHIAGANALHPKNNAAKTNVVSKHEERHPLRIFQAVPAKFILIVAIYCLPSGFMRGSTSVIQFTSSSGVGGEIFSGVAVAMVAIAVLSILVFKEPKMDLAYKLVVPFMSAGLLLLPFLGAGQESFAGAAIMSGYILFEMYVWASLSDMAADVKAPPATVFGIGKSGMNIGLLLGTFLGMYFASSSSMLLVGASVFIIYLFIVIESVSPSKGGVSLPLGAPAWPPDAEAPEIVIDTDPRPERETALESAEHREEKEANGAPFEATRSGESRARCVDTTETGNNTTKRGKAEKTERATIAEAAQMNLAETFEALLSEKCRIVSEEYRLSKREAEVLVLLARGQSLQAAAETLGVAYSTVKTHTDRIYSKTEVHSRSELMRLVEKA